VKKVFSLACFIVVAAVLIFSGIKFYQHKLVSQYENTAVPYVKMVVPEISKWDSEIIKKYMTADSLSRITQEKMDKILVSLSKLGRLKNMKEPVFSSKDFTSGVKKILITYNIDVEYENGEAVFSIGLIDEGNDFLVQNFNVNTKVPLN
jgi:hypothetical protein